MSDENEVTDLLDGEMTIDEVADRFRRRHWPGDKRPDPAKYLDLARRAQEDPDPWVPGSWDDVAAAYFRHEISNEQYAALADAVAEAERAEGRGEL
jgi:hypothetical protein